MEGFSRKLLEGTEAGLPSRCVVIVIRGGHGELRCCGVDDFLLQCCGE